MTSSRPGPAPYEVRLLECPTLSDAQRAAAELRFRMSLEAALGGPEYVLPSLQAYMLAQSLNDSLADDHDDLADDDTVDEEAPDDADQDDEAEEQVIALWENAEAQAILAAMKPLGDKLVNAQFQIVPRGR